MHSFQDSKTMKMSGNTSETQEEEQKSEEALKLRAKEKQLRKQLKEDQKKAKELNKRLEEEEKNQTRCIDENAPNPEHAGMSVHMGIIYDILKMHGATLGKYSFLQVSDNTAGGLDLDLGF